MTDTKYYPYLCHDCGFEFEAPSPEPDGRVEKECPHCETITAKPLPSQMEFSFLRET